MRGRLLVLVLVTGAAASVQADPPPDKARVDSLIAQLVSPNREPELRGPWASYPAGYDRAAQAVPRKAFLELQKLGPAAFPHLFDHLGDKRYALTEDVGECDANLSVGALCRFLLCESLQPYGTTTVGEGDPRQRPRKPYYPDRFRLHEPAAARKWWRSRQDKSLVELQIEVAEWIVREESKSPEYTRAERDRMVEILETLHRTRTPIAPGVPWAR